MFSIITLLVSAIHAGAQISPIDSLWTAWRHADSPDLSTRIELVNAYLDVDSVARAIQIAEETQRLALEVHDSLVYVNAGRLMAWAYNETGKYDSADRINLKLLPVAVRNNYEVMLSRIYGVLGISATMQSQYGKALEYHFNALEMREKLNMPNDMAHSILNIGYAYFRMRDDRKALDYIVRGLELKRKIGNYRDVDIYLNNLALVQRNLGHYVDARKSIGEAQKLCGDKCPKKNQMMFEFTEGLLDIEIEDPRSAEGHLLTSLKLAEELQDQRFVLSSMATLLKMYRKQKKFGEARKYFLQAERHVRGEVDYLELFHIYKEFFLLCDQMGYAEKAANYRSKYISLYDKVYSQDLTISLMRVQSAYQEKENLQRIESQKKLLLIKDDRISHQRILNLLVIITVVLLSMIAFFLYRMYWKKRRINSFLKEKVNQRTYALYLSFEKLRSETSERAVDVRRGLVCIRGLLASVRELNEISFQGSRRDIIYRCLKEVDANIADLTESIQDR